jgi:aldehyde dehydrogenase (NAD+)
MHRMLVDGKLVAADRTYPSVNPATGHVIDLAPDASVADAQAAVAAARHAFDSTSWATDVEFRARCLDQLHQALTEHREELRELTIADVGAPRGCPARCSRRRCGCSRRRASSTPTG